MHVYTAEYHRELRRRRKQIKLPFGAERLLAILEGIEGGFAIGAGIVVGLSFATDNRTLLLITATISLLVNGFNSSAVKYSAEHYTDELDGREKQSPFKYYFVPALLEFVAYFIVCLIILVPLKFISNINYAAIFCVAITLITLFMAGLWRGYLMQRRHKLRDGVELAFLGSLIILFGALSGLALHTLSV